MEGVTAFACATVADLEFIVAALDAGVAIWHCALCEAVSERGGACPTCRQAEDATGVYGRLDPASTRAMIEEWRGELSALHCHAADAGRPA